MDNENNNYGCLKCNLGALLKEKGYSRTKFCKITDMQPRQLNKWINNEITYFDMHTICKICTVLNCSIGDLLEHIVLEETEK